MGIKMQTRLTGNNLMFSVDSGQTAPHPRARLAEFVALRGSKDMKWYFGKLTFRTTIVTNY